MYLVWFFIIFFFVTLYGSKNGCRPVFSQKFFGFVSFASPTTLPDSIKRGVFFVFFIFRFSFISKFGSFINYPVIKFSNMWQSASLNTSFRPGTLYNPNYNSSVQGVGTNQLPHDVFTSKPGVGPVDLGLEAKSDALASSGRRAMGMSPRGIHKKDILSIGSEGDMYSHSSTSKLGRNLFENSMTQREAKVFGGNPPGSDAGKANAARHENLKDYMCKPLIGTFGVPLTDGDYNEDFARLPAKFSPASRTVRKSCADFASRHPNGRPFSNVILSNDRGAGEDLARATLARALVCLKVQRHMQICRPLIMFEARPNGESATSFGSVLPAGSHVVFTWLRTAEEI